MGLFDVFKKKDCEICGKEVGMLGYKKLEDGEICKDCVKLLSPWFDDRRHSTVEQIKRQIAAREENSRQLQSWNHNQCFGEWQKVYIRMANGVPESFVVSADSDYKNANADIISFKNVSSCDVDIHESHTELKQTNSNGERVSYNPPRFEYSYDFYIKLNITGIEYIDDIRFKINRSTLHLETVQNRGILIKAFDPMLYPEYRLYRSQCDELSALFQAGMMGTSYSGESRTTADPAQALVEQIRNAPDRQTLNRLHGELVMMTAHSPNQAQIREQAVAAMTDAQMRLDHEEAGVPYTPVSAASVPKAGPAWTCDCCGTENTGKFCHGCGAAKPAPAPAASGWKCFCGTVNTGKFCAECGTEQYTLEDIECSECSWTAEPGDVNIPTFCPNCGKRFNADDIK